MMPVEMEELIQDIKRTERGPRNRVDELQKLMCYWVSPGSDRTIPACLGIPKVSKLSY